MWLIVFVVVVCSCYFLLCVLLCVVVGCSLFFVARCCLLFVCGFGSRLLFALGARCVLRCVASCSCCFGLFDVVCLFIDSCWCCRFPCALLYLSYLFVVGCLSLFVANSW